MDLYNNIIYYFFIISFKFSKMVQLAKDSKDAKMPRRGGKVRLEEINGILNLFLCLRF